MSDIRMIGEGRSNIPWQDKPEGYELPVWRYSENPIINRNPLPDVARIFNSGFALLPSEIASARSHRSKENEIQSCL